MNKYLKIGLFVVGGVVVLGGVSYGIYYLVTRNTVPVNPETGKVSLADAMKKINATMATTPVERVAKKGAK